MQTVHRATSPFGRPMSTRLQIEQAIGTHSLFKLRLKNAITSGRPEDSLVALGSHEDCPFGKWMTSAGIAPATRASTQFATVQQLHIAFHAAVAKVADMAVSGKANEAKAAIEKDGEFGIAATELLNAMQEWKAGVGAKPMPRPSQPVQALVPELQM
jgi:hypothetical protein